MAIIAVKDINKGKEFYGKTLGLKQVHDGEGGVAYESGGGQLFVYESKDNAGTNKATCIAFEVKDIEKVVEDLKSKDIKFEHYEGLGELQGDIHIWGSMKAAWFKDPDGNIISIDQSK